MIPATHRQILLARRPTGYPAAGDFRIAEAPVPEPGPGQLLVRVVYLSVDPYMRGRMSEARSYVPPVALGDVMEGGTVGEVVRSSHPRFAVGDVVEGRLGWQEYAVSDGKGIRKLDPTAAPIEHVDPGGEAFGGPEVGQLPGLLHRGCLDEPGLVVHDDAIDPAHQSGLDLESIPHDNLPSR